VDKVYQIPDRSVIEQEALDWLIRLDRETAPSSEELQELSEWLGRGPAHREELNSLNAFWSNNVLTELVVPLGSYEKSRQRGLIEQLGRWFFEGSRGYATAAAAVLVIGIAIVVSQWLPETSYDESNGLYLTAVGQQKTVTFADGSVISLNTNSQIEVEYSQHYRNIRLLLGEVHFEVAKNPERPFRVYAGGGRVEAVGTAFTVHLKDRDLSVLVTEGRVALASLDNQLVSDDGLPKEGSPPATQSAELLASKLEVFDAFVNSRPVTLGIISAGQRATVNVSRQLDLALHDDEALADVVKELNEDELKNRQSWRKGMLVFNGETLAQVVQEISRFTTVTIEFSDPELGNIQIGGRLRIGEIDDMFGALETNFGLEVTRLSYDRVQLSAAK